MSERHPSMSISEGRVFGDRQLFADARHPSKIRVVSHPNVYGGTEYELESPLELDRHDVSHIIAAPLGIADPNWGDIQQGLRKISYPSRSVTRMARSARNLGYLKSIQHDAGAIARSMTEFDVAHVNAPVFDYEASRRHASGKVRQLDKQTLQIMVEQLFEVTIDSKQFRKWTPRQWRARTPEQRQIILDTFHDVLMGIETPESSSLSQADILNVLLYEEIEELDYLAAEQLFERFTLEANTATDDSGDNDVYIRESDIPPGVSADKATRVALGRHLDPLKSEGLPRRSVEFRKKRTTPTLQPTLKWTTDSTGKRRFVFGGGKSRKETNEDGDVIQRYASPLLGVALMAAEFGNHNRYKQQLERHLVSSDSGRWLHGLAPMVFKVDQADVLDNPYIRAVERLADE